MEGKLQKTAVPLPDTYGYLDPWHSGVAMRLTS
jgi:hypothetical protein